MRVLVTGLNVKAATPRPTTPPPEGYTYGYDPASDSWDLVRKTASINATLLSEFRHRMYPTCPQDIDVGSKVYVRATKQSGKVVRVKDEIYRVDSGGRINSYFKQELEPLPDNAV